MTLLDTSNRSFGTNITTKDKQYTLVFFGHPCGALYSLIASVLGFVSMRGDISKY
jgi:hypothetical protein